MKVPYNENNDRQDLKEYPFFPNCSENVFEQQKHSSLPRDRAIAMQKANKQAADAAVAALNKMTSGAEILKEYRGIIDAENAVKIATNKPTTWYYLHLILMQRQISRLLAKHKVKLGINPEPVASKF
jgi:hypothetical protein